MKKFSLSVAFLVGISVAASAQATNSATTHGTNPNPDAPVNVSAPALRPAQPASYTASPIPDAAKGQYYVKEEKPATSDGRIINMPTGPQPSKEELMRNSAPAAPAPAPQSSKPAVKKSSR